MKKLFAGTSSGVLALVGLAAFYGITAVLARYLSAGNGLFEQWYLRFGIAFVVALIVFRKQTKLKKFLHLPLREWLVLLLRVLSGGVAAVALYTLAAQHAKIGPVAFMQALPMVALLSVVLLHEKLTLKKGALVLLSFAGAAIVVVTNPRDLLHFNSGEIYSLISGIFFALLFVTRKWHTGVLNNQEIVVATVGLGWLFNYILSVTLYHRVFVVTDHWSPLFVIVLLAAGIAMVANVFLLNYGFERISGIVAGNILSLEQVFGPLFGYLFYREGLTSRELIGGTIIVVAALLMNRLSAKETPAMATPD